MLSYRRHTRAVPFALQSVLIVVLLAFVMVSCYYGLLFIQTGLALRGVIWDDTAYSKGYSEEAFRRVQIGWRAREVNRLLGDPLRKYRDEMGDDVWQYSWKGRYGWRVRNVVFRHSTVARKVAMWEPG